MDKAIEWLREKGLAAAQKKAGRIAAEGMAYAWVCPECGVGAIVEVNAESDFVAKNDLFVDYVKKVAQVVAKEDPADLDALFACKYPPTATRPSSRSRMRRSSSSARTSRSAASDATPTA